MLQKIYFMVFERYIPELKKYDGISFLHQPMTSGQPLKIVQRHMAHPVSHCFSLIISYLFIILRAKNSTEHQKTILGLVFLYEITDFCTKNSEYFCHNSKPSITNCGKLFSVSFEDKKIQTNFS